ncbi:MAG: hypothetical protein SCALA702_00570 [Melioribacteraceae bacterium]|nr:MAG: hypothetical protein SCALA702_00570 [Melioribacteraceae bacterium]
MNKTGSCEYPYTSWETACDSIRPVIETANDGDTIYVGEGVFIDTLDIYKELTIIGLGIDKSIINCDNLRPNFINVYASQLVLKNLKLIGTETQSITRYSVLIYTENSTELFVESCMFDNTEHGIVNYVGNTNINNCVFRYSNESAVVTSLSSSPNYSRTIIKNSVFDCLEGLGKIISFEGRYLEFRNNICLNSLTFGIYSITCDTMIVENNIISTVQSGLSVQQARGKVRVVNNVFHNGMGSSNSSAIYVVRSPRVEFYNNIVYRYPQAVELRREIDSYDLDYNCIYRNTRWFDDTVSVGVNNIIKDPMFVKTPGGSEHPDEFDLRLQKYSPCIDQGHPDIIDPDGTRSDIGVYGGPFGMFYDYEDLPPAIPVYLGLTTINDSTFKIYWNANTESDLAGYKIYMGEKTTFEPSVNNLISITDTSTFILQENISENRYIKITSYDNQGNESEAGEVLAIVVTGVEIRGEKEYEYKLL